MSRHGEARLWNERMISTEKLVQLSFAGRRSGKSEIRPRPDPPARSPAPPGAQFHQPAAPEGVE
jgi:hypothetical protein